MRYEIPLEVVPRSFTLEAYPLGSSDHPIHQYHTCATLWDATSHASSPFSGCTFGLLDVEYVDILSLNPHIAACIPHNQRQSQFQYQYHNRMSQAHNGPHTRGSRGDTQYRHVRNNESPHGVQAVGSAHRSELVRNA